MTQIALIKISEDNKIEGYYLVEDVTALEGLGKQYEFEKASQSHNCLFPLRQCITPGYENCCCFYLGGGREIPVSCHN